MLQPDLLYLSNEQLEIVSDKGVEGPPDIVIEVVSPSNVFIDRNQKKKIYLDFGVKEFWIVDPGNKTLEVYTPKDQETPILYVVEEGNISSSVLTNLTFDLKEIF